MPHITVEYSANLEQSVDIASLVRGVHSAVLQSGVFRVAAIRTRAERRDLYIVADGDPSNAFIHVDLHVAPGRDAETRRRVAQLVLDVVTDAARDVIARAGIGLSVEVREIDNTAALRLNNLHERMAAKDLSQVSS